jgi:hypothetical protein
MPQQDLTSVETAIEECLDEINEFIATLDRYPPTMIAVALSVHLQSLLRAMLEFDLCTQEQVREFVQELERESIADSET